jgi:Tfp pilus assembly protein FimT
MVSALAGIVFAAMVGLIQQWKLRSRVRQLETRLAQERRTVPAPVAHSPVDEAKP